MFGLFKKKWTIEQTLQAFPVWEKSVTICLATCLDADLQQRGVPIEISRKMAAQGVNYIVGEDWKAGVSVASPEIRSIVEPRMSEIEPAIKALLAKDKSSREIIVYFLRIKTVILAASRGFEAWMADPMKDRIEQILSVYGKEFPKEADPGEYDVMALNFQRKVFPRGNIGAIGGQ